MAQVIRIAPGAPVDYVDAVDRYLGAAGVADSSRRIYRISLTTWAWLLTGEQPPARRWAARPPSVPLGLPAPPDRTRALSHDEVAAVLRLDVSLREKTYWRLLHESAARADEVLTLDVGDLDLRNKRARVVAKGGAVEWI